MADDNRHVNKMEISDAIPACLICPSIRVGEEWIDIGRESYEQLRAREKENGGSGFSSSYCSVECFAKGSGISLDEAESVWKKIYEEN